MTSTGFFTQKASDVASVRGKPLWQGKGISLDLDCPKGTYCVSDQNILSTRTSYRTSQYKEMADRLGIATKTVENIKANILHKLGINNTVELFRYALSNGIISL